MHCPSDSDSDFESPKKRQRREPIMQGSSPQISSCNTPASHVDDHTYAKDADQADFTPRWGQIPESAQKILPSGYQYKFHEFREIPTENFTDAPQDNFYVKLSVSHITTKEDVDHWLQQFRGS